MSLGLSLDVNSQEEIKLTIYVANFANNISVDITHDQPETVFDFPMGA